MGIFKRACVLCVAFATLAAQAPVAAPGNNDGADFCTRLGRNMGLSEGRLADGAAGWTANALNIGQRLLIGGTATTSVGVDPAEPLTVEGFTRASEMCVTEGKAAVCRLAGPVSFRLGWKGTSTVTPVLPTETAIVRVDGSRTSCQTGTSTAEN